MTKVLIIGLLLIIAFLVFWILFGELVVSWLERRRHRNVPDEWL